MGIRPINLNLLTLRFPITAIASILHRISGFILFLFIPFFLVLIDLSLQSPEGFSLVRSGLSCKIAKVIILSILFALFYHILAGIRHLIMDIGFGEKLAQARFSAGIVMFLSLILLIVMGIYLW